MTTIGPALDGAPSLFSVAFDLETVGYTVTEHFASGTAERYAHVGGRDPDGRWEVEPAGSAEFITRFVVIRPRGPTARSGTVVVEWLNVTGGLDVPAVWMATHRQVIRSGATWVGVTVQQVGIRGGGGVMDGLALREISPERYGSLEHPGDAFAFDLFSRVGRALREWLPAALGVSVDRMIAVGASQSAIYLTTYVNAVDRRALVFDAFLLQGRAGAAVPIEGWDPAAIRLREDEDRTARRVRLRGTDHIRADARVPVMVVQSETDVFGSLAYLSARQDDGDLLRLWEVAGAAHCDTYFLLASPHDSGSLAIEELAALIGRADESGFPTAVPINSGPQMHYVLQCALHGLERWLRDGTPPPSADRLATGTSNQLLVDDLGVARGGTRTPWVDAPLAVLSGLGQSGVLTELFGTTLQLPPGALSNLYPGGRADHAARFRAATRASIDAGFLLDTDGAEIEALGAFAWPAHDPAG